MMNVTATTWKRHFRLSDTITCASIPKKCSIGLEGGKFLFYMKSARGIKANPDKCREIIEMKSPKNVLEV